MDDWHVLDLAVAVAVGVCLGLVVAAIAHRPAPVTVPADERE